MKSVFLASVFFLASLTARAADTAYSALRLIGKQSGADSLNRVIEVRGRGGAPTPAVWKVILEEPRARGGIREVEVQRGKIIAERTPVGRPLGTPMNFNQLNLDSEGAYTIATQEAEKTGVVFDRVDYVLRSGTRNSAPIWDLQLHSARRGMVASLQLAADSGTVLQQEGFNVRNNRPAPRDDQRPPAPPVYEDRDYVERGPVAEDDRGRYERRSEYRRYERRSDYRRDEEPEAGYADEQYDERRDRIHNVPSFLRRVGKHFEKRGVQIKNFFVGE
ncbi:MAG: hypothetical protein V4710_16160 [Verrucomicrobiota bacterium]